MRTERQRRGSLAEGEVAAYVERLGWRVIARNLRVGRDEIDVLALDPGPPAQLVAVEVRSLRSASFGAPEEGVDRRKVARMYRALLSVVRGDQLSALVTHLPRRVDLVVVDRRCGGIDIRHLRSVEPP